METTKEINEIKKVEKVSLAIAQVMAEIQPENQDELEIILSAGVVNYLVGWMKFQDFEKTDIEMSLWCLGRSIAHCSDIAEEL